MFKSYKRVVDILFRRRMIGLEQSHWHLWGNNIRRGNMSTSYHCYKEDSDSFSKCSNSNCALGFQHRVTTETIMGVAHDQPKPRNDQPIRPPEPVQTVPDISGSPVRFGGHRLGIRHTSRSRRVGALDSESLRRLGTRTASAHARKPPGPSRMSILTCTASTTLPVGSRSSGDRPHT
jgi:hypothetical protein